MKRAVKMKVKVCGMRDAANIEQVAALKPDYMGFVFYEPSARCAAELTRRRWKRFRRR